MRPTGTHNNGRNNREELKVSVVLVGLQLGFMKDPQQCGSGGTEHTTS